MYIAQRDSVRGTFLKDLNKQRRLTKYLQNLSGVEQDIAPYALRIGGRTWFLANELDRQFVDFLGARKSPEASARYFRAAPREVLRYLREFFINVRVWSINYWLKRKNLRKFPDRQTRGDTQRGFWGVGKSHTHSDRKQMIFRYERIKVCNFSAGKNATFKERRTEYLPQLTCIK